MTTADETAASIFGSETRVDSKVDESLDEDEDDIIDATANIEQGSMCSSPAPRTGDKALIAFNCLTVFTRDGSVGLFVQVLIFSTPTPLCPMAVAFDEPASAAALPAVGALAFTKATFGVAAGLAVAGFGVVAGFDTVVAINALAAFDAA
jgi:hypothetical protein